MIHTLIATFILFMMSGNTTYDIVTNESFRNEVTYHINEASKIYDVEPMWLTFNLKRESDFRKSVVSRSKHREFGMSQVHGVARRLCARTFDLNLRTTQGQIYCMAALIDHGKSLCGGKDSAMLWYLSGKCSPFRKVKRKYSEIKKRFHTYVVEYFIEWLDAVNKLISRQLAKHH